MKSVIITQDDPFFLGPNLNYLLELLPPHIQVAACVVFEVSPFGKRETFLQKLTRTIDVFGWRFTFRYAADYFLKKFDKQHSVEAVMKKRHVPIIRLAEGINKSSSLDILRGYAPDILVSIAGNQIFKKQLIELAPKGCINLHTALLPKYRGLMPSFWVIKNQESYTGVSVFFVDQGIDSGPIIIQKRVAVGNKTQKQLIIETKKLGMEAICEALIAIENNSVNLIPNPDSEMTYYSFPTRSDVNEFRKLGKKFF